MTNDLEVVQGKVFDMVGAADAVIAQMDKMYLALKINGPTDKKGYEMVHAGKMAYVHTRIKVEKKGLELRKKGKATIEDYLVAVNEEEKRILKMLKGGEERLTEEEKAYTDALKAIEEEKARLEAERIQGRIDRLLGYGMGLFGMNYRLPFPAPGHEVPEPLVRVCSDEQFEQFCGKIEAAITCENTRLAEIEAKRLAEEDRVARINAEVEAERKKFAAIIEENVRLAREAEEKEKARLHAIAEEERKARIRERLEADERERQAAVLRAERENLRLEQEEWTRIREEDARQAEAAKQKVIDDARHAEALEAARVAATLQARKDAEEKIKREAQEKADREEKARIAAEKKLARAPDKEKITKWVGAMLDIPCPALKSDEAMNIWTGAYNRIQKELDDLLKYLEEAL